MSGQLDKDPQAPPRGEIKKPPKKQTANPTTWVAVVMIHTPVLGIAKSSASKKLWIFNLKLLCHCVTLIGAGLAFIGAFYTMVILEHAAFRGTFFAYHCA